MNRANPSGRWLSPAPERLAATAPPGVRRWAVVAADLIPAGARVLELGHNPVLETFLPSNCRHFSSEFGAGSNFSSFPFALAEQADVVTILGRAERVANLDGLLEVVGGSPADLIVRIDSGGDVAAIAAKAASHGLSVVRVDRCDEENTLIKLRKTHAAVRESPLNVAVISFFNAGNFGDRLGYHIVNSILPSRCQVEHVPFDSLANNNRSYDLVIAGIGNSLFSDTLNPHFFRIVESAKAAVGIFGTQYREEIARGDIDRLIDRLDTWFARYKEDVFIYGGGKTNVVHVGDWLISQFPMATSFDSQILKIGDKIWNDLPLDRTIQNIQRYKQVFSTRLHPLLCALTSAERVAYAEQRDSEGRPAGKFRSMLLDVFDRSYAEQTFFKVDRDKVARYRTFVQGNIERIRTRLSEIVATL